MARVKAKFESVVDRPLVNTDTLFDLAVGTFVVSKDTGLYVINGGLDLTLGVVGKPNTFKSMIAEGLSVRACQLLATDEEPYMLVYDSENAIKHTRVEKSLMKYPSFTSDPIGNKTYHLMNKATTPGEEYWKIVTDLMKAVVKEKPVVIPDFGVAMHPLTIAFKDSLSEFEFSGTVDAVLNSDKDDSSLNTNFMKEGLQKSRLIKQYTGIAYRSNIRFVTTVHIGKKSSMGESRFSHPTPELKFLKDDEALKGVTGKFSFLMSTVITTSNATILKDGDRKPLYPYDENDVGETDLQLINVKILRSKSGPSGIVVPFVCSQTKHFSAGLSAFYFIHKVNKGNGLIGSNTKFALALYPDFKLSRKTVHKAQLENPKVFRAIMFTAQLLQLTERPGEFRNILMTPEALATALVEKGYDLEKLMDVRGHWVANPKNHPLKQLSIVDLLNLAQGKITLKEYKA